MDLVSRIESIIEAPLSARGYDIVRIQISGNIRRVLQVMIERQDEQNITVDDCAIVSRVISAIMDVNDPIEGTYTLEVSSPGLERPLVKPKDYQRFLGHMVLVTTVQPINNRKRFQGTLESATDAEISLTLIQANTGESDKITIPIADIRAARLYVDFKEF